MPVLPPVGPGTPVTPSTYTPQNAIDLVQTFAHGIPALSPFWAQMCDIIDSMMWVFYPWSWSTSNLTDIVCVNGQQDYPVNNPDILRPLVLRMARLDVTPNEVREMSLLANLPVELTRTGGLETITSCGFFAGPQFIRLMYATQVSPPQILHIQGVYQKLKTKITDANLTTPFAFPDRYFNVFVEGLKWKVYQLADDPRSGTLQYSKNGSMMRVYTGQLGLFWDELLQMSRTEDLQNGDEFSFPEQPIGVGRSYWPGLYGV